MPFYIFETGVRVEYPPNEETVAESSPLVLSSNNNLNDQKKEISFNLSESFFQIPASLDGNGSNEESGTVMYVPETQYTPNENDRETMVVNLAADQSILLPSISSVLETSAQSALNYRRKSGHFPIPIHQRVADKLEMPSQNPNSPLVKASETADLTEDSLLLALNSSVILFGDEKGTSANDLPVKNNHAKFSLDFLNTPPLHQTTGNLIEHNNNANNDNERVSTQVLLQNLAVNDTQLSVDNEISLLSLDDREKSKKFDPLDLLPNTPTEPKKSIFEAVETEEGHDAIYFPDSFDESNNPFLGTNPNDQLEKPLTTTLQTIDENMESSNMVIEETQPSIPNNNNKKVTSNFEARLRSSISLSPIVNPQEFGPKRIVLSARKTAGSKPAPLSIKPSNSLSKSGSNETVSVLPEPIKKSLGVRMKRVQFNKSGNQQDDSSTPVKTESMLQEEKYLNYLTKSGNPRVNTIIAEPRRTPIAGIKTQSSMLLTSSPAFKSSKESLQGTPVKSKSQSTLKEASLASYYTDLVLSSPCVKPKDHSDETTDSPMPKSTITLDSASNLNFKENQWVFFKAGASFSVGAVVTKTSKTRDIWRVKQSNGAEFTVSASEMCPVAFLRPGDELYLRSKKVDQVQNSGPFKFKRFSPSNALMIELQRESASQLYDCLKITRVFIEKETFTRVRDRFDRGCIEDSQIRGQIMTLNFGEETATIQPNENKKRKRIINLTSDAEATQSQSTPTTKRSRSHHQHQIFLNVKFLITVGDNKEDAALKEKYSRLIESHGGELLTNLPTDHEVPVFKTFLLSNGFKRTPKFMTAIIRGVPRVHFNWIEACCNQVTFIDPSSFATFLIEPPSGCKPTGLLFKGKKFYFSGSSKFKNSWVSVIRLLGGTVSNNPGNQIIILAEDSDKTADAADSCEKVVNVDWLIRCILEKTYS